MYDRLFENMHSIAYPNCASIFYLILYFPCSCVIVYRTFWLIHFNITLPTTDETQFHYITQTQWSKFLRVRRRKMWCIHLVKKGFSTSNPKSLLNKKCCTIGLNNIYFSQFWELTKSLRNMSKSLSTSH